MTRITGGPGQAGLAGAGLGNIAEMQLLQQEWSNALLAMTNNAILCNPSARGRLVQGGNPCNPKPETMREELQVEIDEWIKDAYD